MSDSAFVEIIPWSKKPSFIPNWTRVSVRKSLDEICTAIEVDMSPLERKRLHVHDQIIVWFKNSFITRRVGTGFIDNISLRSSAKEYTCKVTARSSARDIIDSAWSGEIKGKSLLKVVQSIASEFKIQAYFIGYENQPDPSKVVPTFAWSFESPWQKLVQEADNQGLIITSDQAGVLGLTIVPERETANNKFQITQGRNLISLNDTENGSEQFHTYQFTASSGGKNATQTKEDDTCTPRRKLWLNLTDPNLDEARLGTRLRTERNRRKNRRISVTVNSWGLSESQMRSLGKPPLKGIEVLWEPNFIIPVKLPLVDIDIKLLTSQVECVADTKSMSCTIELARPEEFR